MRSYQMKVTIRFSDAYKRKRVVNYKGEGHYTNRVDWEPIDKVLIKFKPLSYCRYGFVDYKITKDGKDLIISFYAKKTVSMADISDMLFLDKIEDRIKSYEIEYRLPIEWIGSKVGRPHLDPVDIPTKHRYSIRKNSGDTVAAEEFYRVYRY